MNGMVKRKSKASQRGIKPKREQRKILFLDIDGVLNFEGQMGWPTLSEFYVARGAGLPDEFLTRMLDKTLLARLAMIMNEVSDVGIVIHSTWRKTAAADRVIPLLSALSGIPEARFLGLAPFKFTSSRTYEIKMWIRDNDPNHELRYAILDDEPLIFRESSSGGEEFSFLDDSFFHTDENTGLTEDVARAVIDHLNQQV